MDIFVYLLGDETYLMADNVNYQLMMFIIHANCNNIVLYISIFIYRI